MTTKHALKQFPDQDILDPELQAECDRLRKLNDELVAARDECRLWLEVPHETSPSKSAELAAKARAILAKVNNQ